MSSGTQVNPKPQSTAQSQIPLYPLPLHLPVSLQNGVTLAAVDGIPHEGEGCKNYGTHFPLYRNMERKVKK